MPTTDYDTLTDEIMGTLIENGFAPIEGLEEEYGLTERDTKVLDYFAERGWDAFRIDTSEAWATLVRWSEDGIDLMDINYNGGIVGEVSFPMTDRGVKWLQQVTS